MASHIAGLPARGKSNVILQPLTGDADQSDYLSRRQIEPHIGCNPLFLV